MRRGVVGGRAAALAVVASALMAPDVAGARLSAVGEQSSIQTSSPAPSNEAMRALMITEEVPCPPQSHAPAALVKHRPHRKRVRPHLVKAAVVRVKPPVTHRRPKVHHRPRPHRHRPVVAAQVAKPVSNRCEVLHPDWLKAMSPVDNNRIFLQPISYESPEVLALPIYYPTPDTPALGPAPFATPTLPFGGGPTTSVTQPSPPGTTPPTTTPTTPTPPIGPPVTVPVSSAPEPSVWLQMMGAVFLAGAALRRRRTLRA